MVYPIEIERDGESWLATVTKESAKGLHIFYAKGGVSYKEVIKPSEARPIVRQEKLAYRPIAGPRRKPTTGNCLCGCGTPVVASFKPGHDSKLKAALRSANTEFLAKVDEAAVKRYLSTRSNWPQWPEEQS